MLLHVVLPNLGVQLVKRDVQLDEQISGSEADRVRRRQTERPFSEGFEIRISKIKNLQGIGQQHLVRLIATVATDKVRLLLGVGLHRVVRDLLLLERHQAGGSFIFGQRQYFPVLLRADMLAQSGFFVSHNMLVAGRADQLIVLQNDTIVWKTCQPFLVQRFLRKRAFD